MGWEEDHVATRGQFFKNPSTFFNFLIFFKPIRVENLKQIRNPRVFFYFFNFSNIFNLHLRPERLKTLLGDKPSGCPGQGLGTVAVLDTLEGAAA